MRKLTVLLNSGINVITIREPFIVSSVNANILVKKAFIFWKYYNVKEDINFKVYVIDTKKNLKFTVSKGYYTFNNLKEIFEKAYVGISLTLDKNSLLATLTLSDKITLTIGKELADLLSFSGKHFLQGATTIGSSVVNINANLEYIKIHCNIIDISMNINESGEKSNVLINLPITTNQSLFGSVQSFTDIESKLDRNKGVINQIEFKVTDQDNRLLEEFGKILLEIYFFRYLS